MKKLLILIMAMTIVTLQGCKEEKKTDNPFFASYDTPFQVPPFDKIDSLHFMPAFEEGMKQHMAEIEAIVNNSEKPTFENTILAFDQSGKLLTRVSKVFYNVEQANTTPQLQDINRKLSPMMTKHSDDIALNPKLFERIKNVYDNRLSMNLDSQQLRVTEKYYRDFVRQGAGLPAEKQERLRQINTELGKLGVQFGENLLAETKTNFKLVIEDKKDLDGLPQDVIDAAAATAKDNNLEGKWVFTLSKPSWIPFLQYSSNRDLREKIYRAYFMRGNNNNSNDNKKIVSEISKLRVEKAQILGFSDFASYVIEENMAGTPARAEEFLMKLWNASVPVAKNEVAEMQKIIGAEGGNFKLASWDWWYYAEKVRKAKYDLDDNELKPYFSLENARDGMFAVAGKLYGITFTKRTDLPVYHNDVETYEVKEANGDPVGILYLDYYVRDSKRGGAWCTDFRSAGWEDGKRVDPVVSLVCNFPQPTEAQPSLLTWDETSTLFHEFGHALHGLFTQGKYVRTAGVVPQDYVELPSQIMENWAGEPEVLKLYAKHYKTGEIIPDQLISKIEKSSLFNQGFVTTEYLAASLLDLDYHLLKEPKDIDVEKFEKENMDRIGLIEEIIPRYRSTYFAHIFDGGYAAGYYVYIWAAVLDADAFAAFKSSGDLYNQELATKFRKYCLAECGSDDGMVMYKKFRGQEPSVESLLERRGLK